MRMLLKVLLIVSFVQGKIYLYNTIDSPSVDFYDCISHESLFYCRRPKEPIALTRSQDTMICHHGGHAHSFADLRSNNTNISTVLHVWKSSIEKAEQYSRYIRTRNESNAYLCQCIESLSFGKNCEYKLPMGTTLTQTLNIQILLKRFNPWYVQSYGDIICYNTLSCNSGLLCLDWRDICDGVQQCMSGIDEKNCEKLEFNECEKDEYRCMNGMCIPEEYFLDGIFDCLDWSDELQYYDDANCPIESASIQCDDRICPSHQFSCGDGQCIVDRFGFQKLIQIKSECRSRREQFRLCETHFVTNKWTLPSGRCHEGSEYEEDLNGTRRTIDEKCEYLLKCSLADGLEKHCPCGRNSSCEQLLNETCPFEYIQYPKGGILAPYILFFYYTIRNCSTYAADFLWINNTIVCDGVLYNLTPTRFPYISDLHQLENVLCQLAKKNSNTNEPYCHNHSNSSSTICNQSRQCISTHRIRDGFIDCVDELDESAHPSISTICSPMQRYRFRCSANEPTCLSITALGNLRTDCQNTYDEHWLGTSTQLSAINCNKLWKDECEVLREYIENSWISNSSNQVTAQFRIPFHHYCDTFWNLVLKEDENLTECRQWWICSNDQWQCATKQCIDEKWVLDGEWDCPDASDEDLFSEQLFLERNLQVVPISTIENRSIKLNKSIPFSSFCNLITELPCLPINFTGPLNNFTNNRPCVDRHRLGDGHIDCHGGIDERNTLSHCHQPSMLGYSYKCPSSNQCIPYWKHSLGGECCSNRNDDWFWCNPSPNIYIFACFDGTFLNEGRCDRIADCFYGEDEYMCEYQTFSKITGLLYRQDKESMAKNTERKLRLTRFPFDSNFTEPTSVTTSTTITTTPSPNQKIAYWCNRGIGIELYNGSIACFCPPQYYGEKCQYHADRLTIRFHLDLSQSMYTSESDIKIVVKMIILLIHQEKIMATHAFHVRVASEYFIYTKKVALLSYSRSLRFNQSTLHNDHSYSIRIEMYERANSDEPVFIAVWQYPLDFHYLPVYRFAKVLRLIKINPCSTNPCNAHQDCQPLMNNPSKYICLCKANFTGDNCSIEDQQCANGFCFPGSICKPNYRGILIGNHLPYCICPFDQFGERCEMKHDQCLITPCRNNGTCYPASRPDSVTCICPEEYHGSRCEFRKPEVRLSINESIQHLAAVVQYFDIDFLSLNLILVHQEVYRRLPQFLEYRHGKKTAPEIILVKLYSSLSHELPVEIYPISININATTIYATSQVTDNNRCVDIRTLISDNDTEILSNDSPIKYHSFCRNQTDLFCFHDDFYLCFCDENHSRVECFRYDWKLDQCSECLAGGRCLKGIEKKNFICLCPACHSGKKCQFNSNSFGFTLDQLFFNDLISKLTQETALRLLIIVPLLLFLFAFPNNLFSIATFRRSNCLGNGIGQYLLYMSIINQLNLGLLAARTIHLALNITGMHSSPTVNHYLCKILSYLLTSSSRMVYWLSSLVAIERVYMTLFLNRQWLKKPHIARRLIVVTVISILISHIHELVFVKSVFGVNDGSGGMCVIEFPIKHRSKWLLFHLIISIMNSILPLLINICCTTMISYTIAKNKLNLRKRSTIVEVKQMSKLDTSTKESYLNNFRTRYHLAMGVLSENKELIIGPGITLVPQLFSLPLFVISFTLYCQNLESSWVRYLLIVSYFTSFIPQLTSFMLYIMPSSFYLTEWHETQINRWISVVFRSDRLDVPTSRTFEATG